MNAPVQGTASDMIKIAMVRMQAALTERGLRARMLLQVHDELLFEAPPDEVAAVEALAPRDHGGRAAAEGARRGRRQDRRRLGGGMSAPRKFLLVGLTGGIATGKSTVSGHPSRAWAARSSTPICSRAQVVEPGQPALAQIVDRIRPRRRHRLAVRSIEKGSARSSSPTPSGADDSRRSPIRPSATGSSRALDELAEQGFVGIVVFDAAVMIEERQLQEHGSPGRRRHGRRDPDGAPARTRRHRRRRRTAGRSTARCRSPRRPSWPIT